MKRRDSNSEGLACQLLTPNRSGVHCTSARLRLAFGKPINDTEETIIDSNRSSIRIAASSYLNTAPLIWSFLYGSKQNLFDIVEGVPARCAQLLSASEVDAALVPVIEYQRIEGSLIPNVCVGSKKTVRSVVLVSKSSELQSIRSVALDESSRTSAALVKIIFREFLGSEPRWTSSSPNLEQMLNDNDAALIIGDPAMTYAFEGLRVWDMAGLWRRYTDLGFVFAMWMVRNESTNVAAKIDFAGARDEGLENKAAIIAQYRTQIPLSDAELEVYLTENITFTPDESMLAGLQLYFKLAHKHQLIPKLKPLEFAGEG